MGKKVLVQVPEGLKTRIFDIAESLEEQGYRVFVSAERCYGSCDNRFSDAAALGAKIIHYGHSGPEPVEYREVRFSGDPVGILKRHFSLVSGFRSFGLLGTLQYLHLLEAVKKFLEAEGKEVLIGDSAPGLLPGQILGCRFENATAVQDSVDCFLFIGTGRFHALGVEVEKPVFAVDVERGTVEKVDREEIEKKRMLALGQALSSERFAVLVSTKPGQFRPGLAEEVYDALRSRGKKGLILVFDEISKDKLEGMEFDFLVNTACPRIAEDDLGAPVVNAGDLLNYLKEETEKNNPWTSGK